MVSSLKKVYGESGDENGEILSEFINFSRKNHEKNKAERIDLRTFFAYNREERMKRRNYAKREFRNCAYAI